MSTCLFGILFEQSEECTLYSQIPCWVVASFATVNLHVQLFIYVLSSLMDFDYGMVVMSSCTLSQIQCVPFPFPPVCDDMKPRG